MALPMLRRCCGCLSLEKGCLVLSILSTLCCIAYIIAGSWYLPQNHERKPEDNLISMTIVMFGTLSAISNIVALMGVTLRHAKNTSSKVPLYQLLHWQPHPGMAEVNSSTSLEEDLYEVIFFLFFNTQ
ncbi:jg4136 [Pararge aegeria aegeria]|uniref:Jg4136 protein n=1 Tax=Pararge aegeria aegeria TaxID=348720 RepID=A0A8S4R4W7_9NEOP|nr:jg4136 [Pararge aegeria aegeria]